jgi:hypothetical protein
MALDPKTGSTVVTGRTRDELVLGWRGAGTAALSNALLIHELERISQDHGVERF